MTMRPSTWIAASIFAAAIMTLSAGAGAQRRPCVEETSPPPTPGEQAECWFGRHDYRQASAWCERADLSDESAGNMCFVGFVRAGRFEDAARVAGTLEHVRPAARACAEAFTTGLRVRVVPNPSTGIVRVDDEAYARGTAEVSLAPAFWSHHLTVRFGSRTVAVAGSRLRGALDPETCAARDVVVEGPGATSADNGPPVAGIVLLVAGGAATIAGTVMMIIAEGNAQTVRDAGDGSSWSDVEGAHDSVAPLRYGGGALLGVGAAVAVVGLAVTLDLFGGGDDAERAQAQLRIGPSEVALRGRF